MNFKTTGLLVALLLVVGAVWVFYPKAEQAENDTPAYKPVKEDTQALLSPAPESKSIVRVVVERPNANKPRLVFSRGPKADQPEQLENWRAEEPLTVPVQGSAIDGLVSTMTGLQTRGSFEPGKSGGLNLADAGLAPPVAVVTLTDKNGKDYRFEVGQKVAMSTDTYLRLAGENYIHIVSRELDTQVKKDFDEYRDKKLLTLNPADAVRLAMQVDGKPYEFARGADGNWVIDAPIKAHAEKDPVVELLRKVAGLRTQQFLTEVDAASCGFDHPYLVASITTETKKTIPQPVDESASQPAAPKVETVTENIGFRIGGFADLKQENRYIKLAGQDWVATVAQKDVAPLAPEMAKLRDARVSRVTPNSAMKLSLSAEGLTVMLEKTGGKWQGQGELAELDPAAVNDVLQAFEDLRAIDYVDEPGELAEYGLTEPRAVVSVTVAGSVEPVTLRIGSATKSGRNAYVQRDGQPTVFVVAAQQASRMVVPPLSLRSRNMFSADEGGIQRMVIERAGTRYELVREDGQWKPAQATEMPLDQAPLLAIANDLSHLRARKVVGRGDEGRYGLDKPGLTIQFTVAPASPASQPESAPTVVATTQHTLRVAQREKTAYARFDEDPYVYELDDTVYQVLAAELLERKLFPFAADAVVGVSVIQPSGTLEFAKQGEQWVFVSDPFVKIAQDKVNELVTALSGLKVESFVQYRGGDFQGNGLFTAPLTATLKLKNGDLANVKIEQKSGDKSPLAGWVEQKCVFRLAPVDYDNALRALDYYLQVETPKSEAGKPEGGPADPARPKRTPPAPPARPRP